MKEILAPSKYKITRHEEEDAQTGPCGKKCVYCGLLEETKGTVFVSAATKKTYKVRQKMNCETKNVVYLVSCRKHQFQGVGQTTDMKKRLSNYWSHHFAKYNKCGITEHFLEEGHDIDKDFIFQPIVKISNMSNLPRYHGPKVIRERLEEFELYWQEVLMTIEPHGMNKREEVERSRNKIARRKKDN